MTRRSVTQNTALLLVASIIQKVISFGYVIVVARQFSVADLGQFTTALAFSSIFVIFVDLGLTNVMVREGARDESLLGSYAGNVLAIKILTWIASYSVLAGIALFAGYEHNMMILMLLAGCIMLTDGIHTTLYGVLRVKGNMQYEAVGLMVSQGLTLLLGGISMWQSWPIWVLMLAYIIPSLINAIYAASKVQASHIAIWSHISVQTIRRLLRLAIPFALAGIFARLYSFMDQIVIQRTLSDDAAGLYAIPIKIATAFSFIPFSLVAVLYPRFSASHREHPEQTREYLWQASTYLLAVSAPIAMGIGLLAEPIISLVYGPQYDQAVLVLQWIMVGVVASFQAPLFGAALNAIKRQHVQTTIVGVVMALTVTLQGILIPRYGILGGGIAYVCSQWALVLIGYVALPAMLRHVPLGMVWRSVKIIGVTALMGIGVWYVFMQTMSLTITIVSGALIYAGALVASNTWSWHELQELRQLMVKK